MNMNKIEELIEKGVSREEAKKLLTEEEFEEFEKILEMKSVLSEMRIEPPQDMQKRVLEKIAAEKKRNAFSGGRFRLVFTVTLVVVFAGLVIARGFIPSLSPLAPGGARNRAASPPPNTSSGKKGVSPESQKGLQMFSPVVSDYSVKVIVNSKDAQEKVLSVLKDYCGETASNGICKIDSDKFDKLIEKLKRYGRVEYVEKDMAKSGNKQITVKVEVILQ